LATAGSTSARPFAAAFDPASVTFVSAGMGWALGTRTCGAAHCLQLQRTSDSGRSWTKAAPLPAALARLTSAGLNVRFADPRDGWIWGGQGRAVLWSTHDGGRAWRSVSLPSLRGSSSILDLEAAAGTAYLLSYGQSNTVSLVATPVAGDTWRAQSTPHLGLPAGGGNLVGALVFYGRTGWLLEGNDRGPTGSARLVGGHWVSWVPPCASVGGSFAVPAAATATELVAACVMGGFASPLSPSAPKGATLGSTWLYFSHDGRTFSAGPELGGRGPSFGELASPKPGTVLVARDTSAGSDLRASYDGGRSWTTVLHGEVDYLGFTTPVQGVAIGGHRLQMTYDGGRHWSAVRFG
jgi:hypothetical protein